MLDPIADMLTRIRNAQRAGHKEVVIPFSKLKMAIANVFQKKGVIESVGKKREGKFTLIIIQLKYIRKNNKNIPLINSLKRISKQGQRIYVKKNDIHKIKSGLGFRVISTSQGILSSDEARKRGLGGEVICEVW